MAEALPGKLLSAAQVGDAAAIEEIIDSSPSPRDRFSNAETWRASSKTNDHGNNPFHMAAASDRVDALRVLLLKLGHDLLATKNNALMAPIHEAIINNSTACAEIMLKERPDLLQLRGGINAHSPLHIAACNGHLSMVKSLISLGASLDEENDYGENKAKPIHLAVYFGHLEVVKFFLEKKPKLLDERDSCGNHLIHWAATGGRDKSVTFLLEEGANVDLRQTSRPHSTALICAASIGRLSTVKLLVERGADVEARCDSDDAATAIHLAVFYGWTETVEFLLKTKPELAEIKDANGNSLIHWAGLGGYVDTLDLLLNHPSPKIDIEQKHEKYGYRPLHCAALAGHPDAIHFLIHRGADIAAKRVGTEWDDEQLPIHCAASCGHVKVVEILAQIDANLLNTRDRHGYLPFHLAAIGGHVDLIAALVARKDVSVDERGGIFGRTALHMAADAGNFSVCRLLVEKDANIGAQTHGDMAIHLAAKRGHALIVEFFLRKQPELIRRQGHKGIMPLHWAAYFGQKAVVDLLLKYNAGIDQLDFQSRTPLHYAAMGGQLEMAKYLQSLGANLASKSNAYDLHRRPVHLAALYGHLGVVEYFVEQRPDFIKAQINTDADQNSLLFYAVQGGKIECVDFLLKRGADRDLDARNRSDQTALHLAADHGWEKIVVLLIETGADPFAKMGADDRFAPIHLAAGHGHLETVEAFLALRPELLTLRDGRGNLPVHLAALGGHVKVVEFLLGQNGADVDAGDLKLSRTPLHCAAEFGHLELVEALIKRHKANYLARSSPDDNSLLPIHLAAWYGHLEVAKFLVSLEKKQVKEKDARGWTALRLARHNRRHEYRQVIKWLDRKTPAPCCRIS